MQQLRPPPAPLRPSRTVTLRRGPVTTTVFSTNVHFVIRDLHDSVVLEGLVVERASQSHVIIKLLDGEQACNDALEGAARFDRASTTRVNVFVDASGEEFAYVHMHRVTSRDCV